MKASELITLEDRHKVLLSESEVLIVLEQLDGVRELLIELLVEHVLNEEEGDQSAP